MARQDVSRTARFLLAVAIAVTTGIGLAGAGHAQDAPTAEQPQLDWVRGPGTAPIGDGLAEIELSEEFVFLDGDGTRRLLDLTQNPTNGQEVATVAPVSEEEGWFLIFEWDPVGYVPDDERDALDAPEMLTAIRTGTEAANEERARRGWATMRIVGWHEEPHYDVDTRNLTWAIIGESEGGRTINRLIKLLGRRGVMSATLVADPGELIAASTAVDRLLAGYRFQPGNTYAEYVPATDKLAEYGLTALVVGGGTAALVKSGLLARFWKPIAAVLAAAAAGIARLFRGRRAVDDPTRPV